MITNNHLGITRIIKDREEVPLAIIEDSVTPSRCSILLACIPHICGGVVFIRGFEVYFALMELSECEAIFLLRMKLIQR